MTLKLTGIALAVAFAFATAVQAQTPQSPSKTDSATRTEQPSPRKAKDAEEERSWLNKVIAEESRKDMADWIRDYAVGKVTVDVTCTATGEERVYRCYSKTVDHGDGWTNEVILKATCDDDNCVWAEEKS